MSRKMRNQEFSYDEEMAPVTKRGKKKKKGRQNPAEHFPCHFATAGFILCKILYHGSRPLTRRQEHGML